MLFGKYGLLPETEESGFGIIELLVVITISAIFLVLLAPRQGALFSSFDRGTALKQLDADFRRARTEAMAEGARSVLRVRGDGRSYEVGIDFPPYTDPAVIAETRFVTVLPEGVSIFAGDILFDSRGYSINEAGEITGNLITIKHKGTVYASGTVFPAGFLDF